MMRHAAPIPMPLPVAEDDGKPAVVYSDFGDVAMDKLMPWDEQLLGRALFGTPSPDEQWPWQRWREKHELPIDVQVQIRMGRNARRPRIERGRLQQEYAIGWCPYFMARWHVAFAATAANQVVEWQTADEILFCFNGKSKSKNKSLHKSKVSAAVRTNRQNYKYQQILNALDRISILRDMLFDPKKPHDYDPTGIEALTPRTRYKVGSLDANIRAKATEMVELITERIALTSKPDGVLKTQDENVWLQHFAGYMGVAWTRLTTALPAQSDPFEDWVQAGWESLWDTESAPNVGTWASRLRHARDERAKFASHPRLATGMFSRHP